VKDCPSSFEKRADALQKRSRCVRLVIVVLATCGVVGVAFVLLGRIWEHFLFRAVVMRPVPDSVRNIRIDSQRGIREHTHVIRFDVNSDDFQRIADSRTYQPIGFVRFNAGMLSYGVARWGARSSLVLYKTDQKEPDWFDLDRWEDFAAYIVEREVVNSRYKVRLLLYNRQLASAYFIEDEARGRWGGGPISVTDPRSEEIPEWVQQRIDEDAPEWVRDGIQGPNQGRGPFDANVVGNAVTP
jgi:hypothetical protein